VSGIRDPIHWIVAGMDMKIGLEHATRVFTNRAGAEARVEHRETAS
jgi:hypothetical protein